MTKDDKIRFLRAAINMILSNYNISEETRRALYTDINNNNQGGCMITIGPNTIGSASRLLDALLKKHAEEIDKAYLKSEKSFKVDLSVIFNPAEGGGIEMAVGISFIKERCKDSVKGQVKENQDDLFNKREPRQWNETKTAYPATIEIDDETTVDETTVVDSAVAIEGGRPALNAAGNAWIEIE